MPGGYGTYGPWGSAGTTAPSGAYSGPQDSGGGPNVQEESNAVADAINAARAEPPTNYLLNQSLQNQAQLAIAQENIHKGIGKYAGQFPEYDMMPSEDETFQGQNVPGMTTGFGSVFGASSGSTASSETVQDSLNFMIEDTINTALDNKKKEIAKRTGQEIKDIHTNLSATERNQAVDAAMSNFYPKIDQYTEEEFVNLFGEEARGDWLAANASTVPGYANLMGIPEGHTGIEEFWKVPESVDTWDSWEDPWYGGHTQGGGYDDSMADLAKHTWFSESLGDVTARQEERQKAGLGPAGMRASEMEQMYDKNFAAKADPLTDIEFSEFALGGRGTTPAEDILYSKALWEQART